MSERTNIEQKQRRNMSPVALFIIVLIIGIGCIKLTKENFKGVAVKILSIVVVLAILAGGGYFAYRHFMGKIEDVSSHETVNSVEVIKEKLEETAELNTGSYLCTDVITSADSRTFKDWKIP